MGFSHAWVAARGVDRVEFLEKLGLIEVGPGDLDVALNGFGLAELPGGWVLVLCNDFEFPDRALLAEISGEVLSCSIEEHVMYADARALEAGAQVWRVTHDSGKGLLDLQVEGEPPPAFRQIRDEALRTQAAEGGEDAGVDFIFDVPTKLAETICGFLLGESEPDFVELRRVRGARSSRPSLFTRLFGRG